MSQPFELDDIEANIIGNLLASARAYIEMDYGRAAYFMANVRDFEVAYPNMIHNLGKQLSEFADKHYPSSGSQKRNEMREALKK